MCIHAAGIMAKQEGCSLDFSGILADVGIVRTSFLLGFNVPLASQSMQSFSESFGRGAENKESTAVVCEHKPDSRFQYHV